VLDQADLRRERSGTVRQVLEFLGADPTVPAGIDAEFNTNEEKERMTPAAARLWFTLAPILKRVPPRIERAILRSGLFPAEKVGKPALDEGLRAALVAELAGEAERLRAITGKSFSTWSV
jgi:hypothetical protein